jgi:hypothetical protein
MDDVDGDIQVLDLWRKEDDLGNGTIRTVI